MPLKQDNPDANSGDSEDSDEQIYNRIAGTEQVVEQGTKENETVTSTKED